MTTQSVARLSVVVLEKDDSEITQKPGAEIKATETVKPKYILNKNTKKFHKPSCASVNQMNESNKVYSNKSRDEIINDGYEPCGRCHP